MKLAFALPLLAAFSLLLVGCQPVESKLPGTWTSPDGGSLVLTKEGRFTISAGAQAMNGTWTFAEKKITLNIDSVAGKPIKEAIVELENSIYMVNEQQAEQIRKMIGMIKGMQNGVVGDVSEDGKVITTEMVGQKKIWNKKDEKR